MAQLSVTMKAPDFTLRTVANDESQLSRALQHGPVVLAFYKASCPTCQLTFTYHQKIYSEAGRSSKAKIWAISRDEPSETRAFIDQYGLGFDVLVDEHPYPVSS